MRANAGANVGPIFFAAGDQVRVLIDAESLDLRLPNVSRLDKFPNEIADFIEGTAGDLSASERGDFVFKASPAHARLCVRLACRGPVGRRDNGCCGTCHVCAIHLQAEEFDSFSDSAKESKGRINDRLRFLSHAEGV